MPELLLPLRAHLPWLIVAGTLAGAAAMIGWRLAESRRPVTTRSILLPPLGMSTGFLMFVAPATHVPWTWAAAALLLGAAVLAIPLARSSSLVRVDGRIELKRSRAFLWILLGLVAVRFVLRAEVERHLSLPQTGAIFFLLAFGMIARWRIAMLLAYRRLVAEPSPGVAA